MRQLLTGLLIALQLLTHKGVIEEQVPLQPYQFQPSHLQYIQDSIQPPIPQIPINILVIQTVLPPLTVATAHPFTDRTYIIRLNLMHQPLWYETMHHELVHIKQFVRHQLYVKGDQWYWLDQPIDWDTPYHIRPWEVQADLQALQYIEWYERTSQVVESGK